MSVVSRRKYRPFRLLQSAPMVRLVTLFPLPTDNVGISHICLSIHAGLGDEGLSVEVVTPMVRPGADHPFLRPTVPRFLSRLPYRAFQSTWDRLTNALFLRKAQQADIAFLWSRVPLSVSRALAEMQVLVVREKFNCHTGFAKRILDAEFRRLGLPPSHGITQDLVAKEKEELALADYVFASSPGCRESLLAEGVPAEKILESSFGWDPGRFQGAGAAPRANGGGVDVLFVGDACVRKGVHLLLDAWCAAGVEGRLMIAGRVAPDIRSACAEQLARDDVVTLGFVRDMSALYREADVFAFPTLEEGGPLVTYEAMGHGLPVVVSPMGAGAVAREGIDGFVVDAHDGDGWVDALRRLALSPDLRRRLGGAARERAMEFTWDKVAARRRETLMRLVAPSAAHQSPAREKTRS